MWMKKGACNCDLESKRLFFKHVSLNFKYTMKCFMYPGIFVTKHTDR